MRNRLKGISPLDIFSIAFNNAERHYLGMLARSQGVKDRKLCLDYLDTSWEVRRNQDFILSLADQLVVDSRTRYEALRIFQEFIKDYPEKIWPYVLKYGSHPNRHIREALAASVLEVLLAAHHSRYFPEIKRLILAGDRRFLDTLTHAWPFGQPLRQWRQRIRLIKQAGGDLSRVYNGGKYTLPANI